MSNRAAEETGGPKEFNEIKGKLNSNLKILEQLKTQTDQSSATKQKKSELSPRRSLAVKGLNSPFIEDQSSSEFSTLNKLKSDKGVAKNMLSKEYYKVEEDQDIIELREKKEMEIKKKEDEEKHKNPVEKQKKENNKNEKKKEKEIDGKKITFDSEGRQLNIKPIAIEKLPIDFVFINPSIGELKEPDSASKINSSLLKIKGTTNVEKAKATFAGSNMKTTRLSVNPVHEMVVIRGKPTALVKDKNDKNVDSKQNFQPCGSNFE